MLSLLYPPRCLTFFFSALYLCFPLLISAQQYTVAGYVLESSEQVPVAQAGVSSGNSHRVTNEKGYFTFSASAGRQHIQITHIGFDTLRQVIQLKSDTLIHFHLDRKTGLMQEVKVTAPATALAETSPGIVRLSQQDLKNMPSFMGQHDPVKALQSLPGIGNGGEGNSGLFVQGGTSGQNLTTLNGATIYNPSHLLGFFSVFNPDAMERITLHKSGMQAEYGGRLSSVLAVESSRQVQDSLYAGGGISPLAVNLHLAVPLTKSWSTAVSLRKTFMNLTIWPLLDKMKLSSRFFKEMNYDFYDFNIISNAQLGQKDRLMFSWYSGGDDFGFGVDNFGIGNTMDWNNAASSLSWNRLLGTKTSMEHTLSYSAYRFNFGLEQEKLSAGIASAIRDYSYKGSLNLYLHKHKLKAGLELTDHRFKPNSPFARSAGTAMDYGPPNTYLSKELALFISDEISLANNITFYAGIRFNRYFTEKRQTGQSENETAADQETANAYQYIEPRLLLQYRINENAAIKTSFTQQVQPTHLISITAVNFPSDFWMPSLKGVPPERGMQFSTGYYRNFNDNTFESYADLYYKKMHRLVEFSGGIMNLIDNLRIEDYLLSGDGNAYGGELYIKKKTGRLTGWAGYALSWSNRKFPEINNGKRFPAKYDRRHDISATAVYHYNSRLSLSATFVYASGHAYTRPVSRYILNGSVVNEYGPYNGARMPAYHRADIGASYIIKQTEKIKNMLTFSVYNLYSRQNPIYTFFMAEGSLEEYQVSIRPKSVSLLPVLPCISWSFYIR